jgi:hypothetical protein
VNMSLERFIAGLEKSAQEVPELFSRWEGVEEDLKVEYVGQLTYLLRQSAAFLSKMDRRVRCVSCRRIVTVEKGKTVAHDASRCSGSHMTYGPCEGSGRSVESAWVEEVSGG